MSKIIFKALAIFVFVVSIGTFLICNSIYKMIEKIIPDNNVQIASSFICETRYAWNSIVSDFEESRKFFIVYIQDGNENIKQIYSSSIGNKIKEIDSHIEFLKNINTEFGEERQKREATNIIFLITNATNLLKKAVNENDVDKAYNMVLNANKEIELANTYFLSLAEYYNFDIKPLKLVEEVKIQYETNP